MELPETLWSRFENASRASCGSPESPRRQVVSALAAVHQRGIIHRDLKPENIFVVKDSETAAGERAKIDFGIARPRRPEQRRQARRQASRLAPDYMSPGSAKAAQRPPRRRSLAGSHDTRL